MIDFIHQEERERTQRRAKRRKYHLIKKFHALRLIGIRRKIVKPYSLCVRVHIDIHSVAYIHKLQIIIWIAVGINTLQLLAECVIEQHIYLISAEEVGLQLKISRR